MIKPRHIFISQLDQKIKIHEFSEVNLSTHGGCIYIRTYHLDITVSSYLISAKSTVSTKKAIVIVRGMFLSQIVYLKYKHSPPIVLGIRRNLLKIQ